MPERREISDRFGNKLKVGVIGIKRNATQQEWQFKHYGPVEAVGLAVKESYYIVSRTLGYLYDVATRRELGDQLGGPLRIADISGQVASLGFLALINLTAVLSVSIGLINLFPIPLLDGGHLMFYAIEAVRGPPAERAGAGGRFPHRLGDRASYCWSIPPTRIGLSRCGGWESASPGAAASRGRGEAGLAARASAPPQAAGRGWSAVNCA